MKSFHRFSPKRGEIFAQVKKSLLFLIQPLVNIDFYA